jgi:hypothetical protein
MAKVIDGTNGKLYKGPIGNLLYRLSSTGTQIIVPRYRHDAKTAEQTIRRSRFTWVVRSLSSLYFDYIRRYSAYWREGLNPFNAAVGASLSLYSDWYGLNQLQCWPANLPGAFAIPVYGVGSGYRVVVGFNEAPPSFWPENGFARVFFVLVPNKQIITAPLEYNQHSGPVYFTLPAIAQKYHFYSYLFVGSLNAYGIYTITNDSRNFGEVGA